MTHLMTYFDSKRYLSFKKFQDYYEIRKKYFSILPEQEEEYQKMFTSQSIRYTFQLQSTWVEETFESMDGNYLTFYHDLFDESLLTSFMQDTLHYFGYVFGGVSQNEPLDQTILEHLTTSAAFTYELDTIVYRKDDVECYLTLTLFPQGNFAFKLFEKEDYNVSVKEELLGMIQALLLSILQ